MEPSEIIVGLDIGTTKIAAIVGRRNENGKIDILGFGRTDSIGVKRGVVANIDDTVQSIVAAVKEAENRSETNIATVNVGIAGQHIKSIQYRGSIIRPNADIEISQSDIDGLNENMFKLATNPGEEIIDVIPQEYPVDGESGHKQPNGMRGNPLVANFPIITAQPLATHNIFQ